MNRFQSKKVFESSIALLKNKWLPFVLGIPLFFCLHHYEGIICDARLYLLQVINRWQPERFINDPPFMFGNQDSFGIFSFFYGIVVQYFHIDTGTFYFTLFGYIIWLFAAFYFIYKFAQKLNIQLWFLPLLLFFLFYSGDKMPNVSVYFFHYIEYFNCSRLFSIGIAILGLGFLFAEKKYVSLICFFTGTLIHPLTAGWCLPLWGFIYFPRLRMPVVALSVLFPLTFLLHTGPFDVYPADWGGCTRNHDVSFLMLYREFVAVLFFGLVPSRFTSNKKCLIFSRAAFWVLLIGFYWTVTGGVGKHILIYQVQTWRVEWLFFVLAMPVYVYLFLQTRIIHGVEINTQHFGLILFGYSIFLPNTNVCVLLIALIFLILAPRKLNAYLVLCVLAVVCICSTGLQEIINVALTSDIPVALHFPYLYKEVQNLTLVELLFIVYLGIIWLKTKKYQYFPSLLFLVLYLIFPYFRLMPVAAVCLIFFLDKKIKLGAVVTITLMCVMDGVYNYTMKDSFLLWGYPKQNVTSLLYIIPIVVATIFYMLMKQKECKVCLFPFVTCSILLIIFAIDNYDQRPAIRKQNERFLDDFKRQSIFPQIKDRGRIFFLVHGEYISQPRFQFLTGAYFCETTHMGEPLFKGQFVESRKRDNLLFFKENRNYRTSENSYEMFAKKQLVDKDSLLDRVNFLCSINEITHLVSNMRLPELKKQDSHKLNGETMYLYRCPYAKK